MLRAVIFDLDGTVFDSTEAILCSFNHMFDTLEDERPLREAIIRSIGHPLDEQLTFLTQRDVPTCVSVYREHYERTAHEQTFLYPGAIEAFDAFAAVGLKMGFATSKKREAAELLLEYLGVLPHFAARIGPYEVTQPKPHPEPIEKAMAALGVTPEETVFVGDMHFDVLAAQAAGVHCLAVTTGYATREELEALNPDAVYDTLFEVRDHVLRLAGELRSPAGASPSHSKPV